MAAQSHTIRRSVVELRVRDAAEGERLSAALSALVTDRIAPLLDHHFSAVSDPDRVDRIDRLEIDLGRVNPSRLVEDLLTRLDARLPAALGRARLTFSDERTHGGTKRSTDPPARALLVISQFARTGSLPWWSDTRQVKAVDGALETARRAEPRALAGLLRGLAPDPRAIERLVLGRSDVALRPLLMLLSPAATELVVLLWPMLAQAPALAGISPSRLRELVWREAFAAAAAGRDLRTGLLTRLAATAGTTRGLLEADLQHAPPGTPPPSPRPRPEAAADAAVDRVPGSTAPSPAAPEAADRMPALPAPGAEPPADAAAALAARLAVIASRMPALAPLLTHLHPLAAHLPPPSLAAVAKAVDDLVEPGAADAALWSAVAALLRPFVTANLTTLDDLRPALAALPPLPEPAASRPPVTAAGSDLDALYIENAGLCLLWPFLARFFGRFDLLDADQASFVNEPARHRAVGLLHCVASGEREAPEIWLALNKVLCGLDPDSLYRPGPAVTDAEAMEAEIMLEAAIAHAACLGTISPDGFRSSFLLRHGALSVRDGAWLLRAERQPADVLLDRFPWRTEWIRLPWMPAPLRVEW